MGLTLVLCGQIMNKYGVLKSWASLGFCIIISSQHCLKSLRNCWYLHEACSLHCLLDPQGSRLSFCLCVSFCQSLCLTVSLCVCLCLFVTVSLSLSSSPPLLSLSCSLSRQGFHSPKVLGRIF